MPSSSHGRAPYLNQEAPPIAAIFVIKFDQRVGYTLTWQRAIPGLELEGLVEYKSLPSGLHNVKEDLIYFLHSAYAGLSAFRSEEASASERNAKFVSVGVLVQKHESRLGRAWLHKDGVEELAARVLAGTEDHKDLEQYWEQHRIPHRSAESRDNASLSDEESQDNAAQASHAHMSESGILAAPDSSELAPSHPVLSLLESLDLVGPLIFPLYRAALLRKRIVIIARPPLSSICNFVYILSILSSMPSVTADILPENAPTLSWPRPLFSVGIQDIPYLQSLAPAASTTVEDATFPASFNGWIACTSDALLSTKDTLSDIRVSLPYSTPLPGRSSTQYTVINATSSETTRNTTEGRTNTAESKHFVVRATQRDLRRYKALRLNISALQQMRSSSQPRYHDAEHDRESSPAPNYRAGSLISRDNTRDDNENEGDETPLLSRRYSDTSRISQRPQPPSYAPAYQEPSTVGIPFEDNIVEPVPWGAALYGSFMWWASGGNRGFETYDDETEVDRGLWADAASATGVDGAGEHARRSSRPRNHGSNRGALEMAVIAYFHGLTSRMLEALAGIVEAQSDEEDGDIAADSGSEPRKIFITKDDLIHMGLDVWSSADCEFARELCQVYFGRAAEVGDGAGVEICGVRIC